VERHGVLKSRFCGNIRCVEVLRLLITVAACLNVTLIFFPVTFIFQAQLQCICPSQPLYLKSKLVLKGTESFSGFKFSVLKHQNENTKNKKKLNIFNLNRCSTVDENYWTLMS
jgi:hypothetical protein